MTRGKPSKPWSVLFALLMLHLVACSTQPAEPPTVAQQVRIPPLPGEALAPSCPAACQTVTGSCSCSQALTALREHMQRILDGQEQPAQRVKQPITLR